MAQALRVVLRNLRRSTAGLSTDLHDVLFIAFLLAFELCVSPARFVEAKLSRPFVARLSLRQKPTQRREKNCGPSSGSKPPRNKNRGRGEPFKARKSKWNFPPTVRCIWTGSNDSESLQALQLAVDLSCNFFNTAWAYGDRECDALQGSTLRKPHRRPGQMCDRPHPGRCRHED